MSKQQEVLSSVHNAMRILKEFSLEEQELGISELSNRMGIAKSTVFRLMKTLNEANLVEKNEETQKYHLGIAAFELGFIVYHTMEIRLIGLPITEKLVKSTRKVARLGVYDQGGVVYLCKRVPDDDLGTISKIGNRVPSYCTAVGKVLLAHQSEEEIERVLKGNLKPYTSKTITSPDKLYKQLEEIRKTGFAITIEELRDGISSVAVPVYNDWGKVVSAISLTGAKSHFYSVQSYVRELNNCSRLMTEKLGLNQYRGIL
jgi:IclR family KDG regulon transcriptional repressor